MAKALWGKITAWFIGALALINTWEGITHLASSGIGFWGMWDTNTWVWQLVFTTSESLLFGLISVLTGVILGKGIMHHHHHHDIKVDNGLPSCPSCDNSMNWLGDNELEDEVYVTTYTCQNCKLEVSQFWGDRAEEIY